MDKQTAIKGALGAAALGVALYFLLRKPVPPPPPSEALEITLTWA